MDDVLTCSYEDALALVVAFSVDMPDRKDSFGFGIPLIALIPMRDLSDDIRAHPQAGLSEEKHWDGLDYARAVAKEVFDEQARAEGFTDFLEQWSARPETDPILRNRYRLFDGSLVFDTDALYSAEEALTWADLLSRYGAEDDPVVAEYFERMNASVRIDITRLINFYSPLPFQVGERNAIEIGRKLGAFLFSRGRSLESGLSVVNLDEPMVDEEVPAKKEPTKPGHFDELPPPPLVKPAWMVKPLREPKTRRRIY